MSEYEVIIRGLLTETDDNPVPVSEYGPVCRSLMRELMRLDAGLPSVSGTAAEGLLEAHILVEAENISEAAVLGFAQVRTAIHAAGVGTPGWNVQAVLSRLPNGTGDDAGELAALA